jgi:membrane protein YdbS with pleckstrin-like domain
MFASFRHACEGLLRIPHDPEPPPGDQTSTRLFRAAPNYYRYLLFLWAITSLAGFFGICVAVGAPCIAGAVGLVSEGHRWGLLLLVIPGLVLLAFVLTTLFRLAVLRLQYEKRWYVVSDRSLRTREGVISVREMTVNFANIQNISISQGPVQRALGIADLRVDTAGGGGASQQKHPGENLHTAWFRGINNATEVRELIQNRLRGLKDSGLGDHEELARSSRLPPSAVFLAALEQVHTEARALRKALSPAP